MRCQNCGSQISDNMSFCAICGNPANANNSPSKSPSYSKKTFWKWEKPSGKASFFIVLLALCFFLTSFLNIFICNTQSFFSSNSIESIIENVPYEDIIDDFEYEINEFQNILKNDYGATVSDTSINLFLTRSTLKSFFAKKAEIFINEYLEKNYAELTIDTQSLYELLLENKNLLCEVFGMLPLSNEQLYQVANITLGENSYCIINSSDLSTEAEYVLDIVKLCLLDSTLIILAILNLLIIFVMIKINVPKGIKNLSIILIIVSSIWLLIKILLVPFVISLIKDSEIFANVINNFFTPSTIIAVVLLLISIVGLILLKIQKSKHKNLTANAFK